VAFTRPTARFVRVVTTAAAKAFATSVARPPLRARAATVMKSASVSAVAVTFPSSWRALDRGFVLSDHADWPGLNNAIGATGAEQVIVTHGQIPVLVRWLNEQGLDASAFETEYGDEEVGDVQPAAAQTDVVSEPEPGTAE